MCSFDIIMGFLPYGKFEDFEFTAHVACIKREQPVTHSVYCGRMSFVVCVAMQKHSCD